MINEAPTRRISIEIHISKGDHKPGVQLQVEDTKVMMDARSAINLAVMIIDAAVTARARGVMCKLAKLAGATEEEIPNMLAAHENMQQHLDAFASGDPEVSSSPGNVVPIDNTPPSNERPS